MVDSREESDSRRYEHLLKWLKSYGMQLDGEHFHVQRKRRPGSVRISFSSRMCRLTLRLSIYVQVLGTDFIP